MCLPMNRANNLVYEMFELFVYFENIRFQQLSVFIVTWVNQFRNQCKFPFDEKSAHNFDNFAYFFQDKKKKVVLGSLLVLLINQSLINRPLYSSVTIILRTKFISHLSTQCTLSLYRFVKFGAVFVMELRKEQKDDTVGRHIFKKN